MTTRTELNSLLSAYETYIGTGNMKQAGRTLPKIIRALVTFVEERTPDYAEPELAAPASPPPCPPCDVSIPNNTSLIAEFKNPLEAILEKAVELVGDMKVDLEEAIEGIVDLAHQHPADDEKAHEEEPAAETPAEVPVEEAGETPAEPVVETTAETPPVEEATTPAPKTPKKPKTTD